MSAESAWGSQGGSLEQLLAATRGLPGERRPGPQFSWLSTEHWAHAAPLDPEPSESQVRALRKRLSLLLTTLSQRVQPALADALRQASVAWDSFDTVAVLDAGLRTEAQALATQAIALERSSQPAHRAAGLELRIALTSALGLIDLCERRLATLVRLRVSSPQRTLLPGGRPFIDIAAALAEAARSWA